MKRSLGLSMSRMSLFGACCSPSSDSGAGSGSDPALGFTFVMNVVVGESMSDEFVNCLPRRKEYDSAKVTGFLVLMRYIWTVRVRVLGGEDLEIMWGERPMAVIFRVR